MPQPMGLRWRVLTPPLMLRWRGPNFTPAGLPQPPVQAPVATVIGPPGPRGPSGSGGSGGGDNAEEFIQSSAVTPWIITHSFTRIPNVAVYDSAGRQVFPDITVVNSATIRLDFSGASDGTAILT